MLHFISKVWLVNRAKCNEQIFKNELNGNFNNRSKLEVLVSDLTYVKVGSRWNYICSIMDLYNREIIGYSVGKKKDKNIVLRAISGIKYPLNKVTMLHTDRGMEFKSRDMLDLLNKFNIIHSLSKKGVRMIMR